MIQVTQKTQTEYTIDDEKEEKHEKETIEPTSFRHP
jgi:hypothetical protein